MTDEGLREVLEAAAEAVRESLETFDAWEEPGDRPGQYRLDLVADAAACRVLHGAGLRVHSEESGRTNPPTPAVPGLLVVLDPVDGSTNASHRLPWYSTSLCVLDEEGPHTSLVQHLVTGVRYAARRGGGATKDGRPIRASGRLDPEFAIVGLSGTPEVGSPWWQSRVLGSAALDLCAVAEGILDGYAATGGSTLAGWDYLGALLVCAEAGAVCGELDGNELVVRDATPRRPVAAATPTLLASLFGVSVSFPTR